VIRRLCLEGEVKTYPALSWRTILLMLCVVLIAACCPEHIQDSPSEAPFSTPSPASTPTPSPVPPPTPASNDPFEQNLVLGRGVNLGNALEAPQEGEWGVVLEEEYFDLIAEAGFDSVRIPIRWSAHASDTAPYTVDPAFFERIDWAVEQALSRDLLAVINIHHYEEIMRNPKKHRERLLALWSQIGEHYQDQPNELLFEILNEPNGAMRAAQWNPIVVDILAIIRETNPERNVVIGSPDWNKITTLNQLELPEDDRHIIVTFHYYDPFQFTHQGAEWVAGSDAWLGTTWEGDLMQKQAIEEYLDWAAMWGEENYRPLYLGEFGAYGKADMQSRALWTAFVARQAEERGMSWAYWEFCSGFGVYDKELGRWNDDLLEALVPSE
jgi:endoglucanase